MALIIYTDVEMSAVRRQHGHVNTHPSRSYPLIRVLSPCRCCFIGAPRCKCLVCLEALPAGCQLADWAWVTCRLTGRCRSRMRCWWSRTSSMFSLSATHKRCATHSTLSRCGPQMLRSVCGVACAGLAPVVPSMSYSVLFYE